MASANVVELTEANWEQEVVKSNQLVLVDFWAPWCYPCRLFGPTVEKVADQFAGQIKVGKLNTDENPAVAVKYKIDGIPQVLFFKGGDQPREQLVGNQPAANLVAVINRLLTL
jgi:thioredoxin 1